MSAVAILWSGSLQYWIKQIEKCASLEVDLFLQSVSQQRRIYWSGRRPVEESSTYWIFSRQRFHLNLNVRHLGDKGAKKNFQTP